MSSKKIIFSQDFKMILLTEKKSLPLSEDQSHTKWFPLDEIHHFQDNEGKLVSEALASSWEFMPGSQPPYSVKIPKDNRIIFFGGSFNPWHAGHEQCLKQLDMPENVFVIPDNNPRKEYSNNSTKCVWSRYQDLKAKIISPVNTYPGFWINNEANPTSSWLPQIKDSHPDLKVGLLIGYDSFMTIHQWIESKKLLNSLDDLYIVSRQDNEIAKLNQIEHLKEFYSHIDLHFLGHHKFEELSSTQLRARS